MIPAWHYVDNTWLPCWLISTTPHGVVNNVLIAFDDDPHPRWGYPPGSLRLRSEVMENIRIRRTTIPLLSDPEGK